MLHIFLVIVYGKVHSFMTYKLCFLDKILFSSECVLPEKIRGKFPIKQVHSEVAINL